MFNIRNVFICLLLLLNKRMNPVSQQYQINGIPANFLIDPNGVIIAKNLYGDQLTNTLARYIK
jgi:hypothetical protein